MTTGVTVELSSVFTLQCFPNVPLNSDPQEIYRVKIIITHATPFFDLFVFM